MPLVHVCAICFDKIDRAEQDFVCWQEQWQHHPEILVHLMCAKETRRRPKAFDYDA